MMQVKILIMMMVLLAASAESVRAAKAKLTQLVGTAEIRVNGATWRAARIDMPLSEKNDLRTFIESEAEITLENGTKIKVGENSMVTLARLFDDTTGGNSQTTVRVATGKIWATVTKLKNAKSEFDFETPTAVASIRGTRLGLTVDRTSTLVDVYEGLVAVKKKGSRRSVNVSSNTRAVVEKTKAEISVVDFKSLAVSQQGNEKSPVPSDPYAPPVEATGTSVNDSVQSPGGPADTLPSMKNVPAGKDEGGVPAQPEEEQESEPSSGLQNDNTAERRDQKLVLTVTSPEDGSTLHEPLIVVRGRTLPDAKVFVNDQQAAVGRDGTFMLRLPLPDEQYTYDVEIRAELDGREVVQQRKVTYSPQRQKLYLECSSPVDGMSVTGKTLRCAGKTAPLALVQANGIPINVSAAGVFSRDIPLTEKDIGEFTLEVVARGDDDEIAKTFTVDVTPRSPQINTSIPVIVFSAGGQRATAQNSMAIQILDRTPQDELTVTFTNNGIPERITTVNGRTEKLSLDEGRNRYGIQVVDIAGNGAPQVNGEIYYLPGPLKLQLLTPSSNYTVFEGLPPVLHPGYKTVEEPFDVEIEIDDGIGTVPESIRYCKVTGNGRTVILRNNNDYVYKGKVGLVRGSNLFTVQAEDLSGRLETLRFTVVVK